MQKINKQKKTIKKTEQTIFKIINKNQNKKYWEILTKLISIMKNNLIKIIKLIKSQNIIIKIKETVNN